MEERHERPDLAIAEMVVELRRRQGLAEREPFTLQAYVRAALLPDIPTFKTLRKMLVMLAHLFDGGYLGGAGTTQEGARAMGKDADLPPMVQSYISSVVLPAAQGKISIGNEFETTTVFSDKEGDHLSIHSDKEWYWFSPSTRTGELTLVIWRGR